MRILITNTGPWGTGSFTVAEALTKAFISRGHDVAFFFPDSGIPSEMKEIYYSRPEVYNIWKFPQTIASFEFPSFPLIITDPHPRSEWKMTYKKLPSKMFHAFIEETEKRLHNLVNTFQPDVIECQHLWLMGYHVSKLNIPFFCTAHHSDQIGFLYDKRSRPYIAASIDKIQKIFSISDFVTQEILTLYHVDRKKIIPFHNGYDKEVFFRAPKEKKEVLKTLGLERLINKTLIAFAGKISKTKGVDILLKATLLMQREDIHLILLGGGRPQEFIAKHFPHGIDLERVHFVGHQSPRMVANIFNISKVGTLPSRSEGFGIACLEAMGCGLPMVVTKTGGLQEIGEVTLVPSEDPFALAQSIIEIVDLPEKEYQALSEKVEARARHFSWEKVADDRLKEYLQVIKVFEKK